MVARDRRHRSAFLFSAAALLFTTSHPAGTASAQERSADFETTRIADGVYMFRYASHNSMFVVTGEGVIAFDPISLEAARAYRSEIERITAEPIRAIVYSHHHTDHIAGAAALAEGVPIIAHVNALRRLQEERVADVVPPTFAFADSLFLRMGGRRIHLLYLGRNHSDNSIVAYLPDQDLIFAVDFVSRDRVGYRDLPDYYFPDLWQSLERLQELDYATAVFGHGQPGTKADVYEQVSYWTDLRRSIESMIRADLSEDEAVDAIELPAYADWGGYPDWFKMNARTVYRYYAERD